METMHCQLFLRSIALLVALSAVGKADAASGTATYTYDNLGRLKGVSYEDSTAQSYIYDAAGNR